IIVSSIVDIDSSQRGIKPTKTIVKSYSINQNLDLDSTTEEVRLKPYDQVFVRINPKFHLQENVKIEGRVLYPGTYPKLNENERLSSFVTRTGGLRENSDPNGAILYRMRDTTLRAKVVDSVSLPPSEPISIDLEKAIKNPDSKYDMVLQNGDIIYVPELNPVVSVKGAVQNQLKIFFDKEHTSLGFYIDKAGGFGARPWRNRIYVTHANGKSQRTRNFGFLHFYPKVHEGSTITVPVKPQGKMVSSVITQTFLTAIPIMLVYFLTKIK
ncbi:MAG: SLBB domain-containing protein, partial [Ginsengibacter sp.]